MRDHEPPGSARPRHGIQLKKSKHAAARIVLAAVLLCSALYLRWDAVMLAAEEILVTQAGFAFMLNARLGPAQQRLSAVEARIASLESRFASWEHENLSLIHLWPDVPTAVYFAPGGIPAGSATLDAAPQIVDGRTMVPLRFVGETLGADVSWDGENRQVTYTTAARKIILTVGQTGVLVEDTPAEMDTAPMIIGDRTMVPVRFVARWLGAVVRWDDEAKRVEIGYLK